jgi:hypothetical protein
MKTVRILLLLLAAPCVIALSGCATQGGMPDFALIQRALDRALSPNYAGDARVEHKNPWVDFTIDAKGLRREADGWKWTSLTWVRNGRASHGRVTL